ncbi:MAG: tetratricopeptide repeat protein [Actinomycetota bacterium]
MYSSRIDSETAYDLFGRGRTLLRDGHPHQAAMLLARAKLIEPDKASIREALGRALVLIGRWPDARREFARMVQLNPADDYAHYCLALACERTGEIGRARGHAKLAAALCPGNQHYEHILDRLGA